MSTRQEDAFLRAIRDEPDDDLHRLAWADWLDDRGDGRRADFIRAQVRLAALSEDDPARDALEDEADDLLEGHDQEWAGRVGELTLEWSWSRGCVERVTVWGDTLLTQGDELFAAAPIRKLRILTETGDTMRLAAWPRLAHVEALDLSHQSQASAFRAAFHRDLTLQPLFASPHLTRLRRLRLGGLGIEGPLIQTLIDVGLFGRLEELCLGANGSLGDRTARLMAAQRSNTLTRLNVWGTNVGSFGLRQLLQARSWPAMRDLGFNAARLFTGGLTEGDFQRLWAEQQLTSQLTAFRWADAPLQDGLACLTRWEGLSRLEQLSLVNCRLGAADGEVLASCEGLSALRRLELAGNQLRDTGARALAGSPFLTKLSSLQLGSNGVAGPGIRAVASSPTMANLRELFLEGNYVGTAGTEALVSGGLRRLRRLDLSSANLDAECARSLFASPALAGLRVLSLIHNPLDDAGVKALAASPHVRRLRSLYLDSCSVGCEGALALAESAYSNRLTHLSLRNTFVTGRERERLTARYGAAVHF